MDDLAKSQLEDDPEIMTKRLGAIDKALNEYDADAPNEEKVTDFLADLMHWCEANGVSFYEAHRLAEMHYACEQPDPKCPSCGNELDEASIELLPQNPDLVCLDCFHVYDFGTKDVTPAMYRAAGWEVPAAVQAKYPEDLA